MLAERLGSPMTSIICVGAPGWVLSVRLSRLPVDAELDVPEKGLLRTIWNSPDGGGATARGMLCSVEMEECVTVRLRKSLRCEAED